MATDRPLDLDRLTLDAVRDGALREQPVTVLGFARSGIALARFFSDAGATVTVYDGRPEAARLQRRSGFGHVRGLTPALALTVELSPRLQF